MPQEPTKLTRGWRTKTSRHVILFYSGISSGNFPSTQFYSKAQEGADGLMTSQLRDIVGPKTEIGNTLLLVANKLS